MVSLGSEAGLGHSGSGVDGAELQGGVDGASVTKGDSGDNVGASLFR